MSKNYNFSTLEEPSAYPGDFPEDFEANARAVLKADGAAGIRPHTQVIHPHSCPYHTPSSALQESCGKTGRGAAICSPRKQPSAAPIISQPERIGNPAARGAKARARTMGFSRWPGRNNANCASTSSKSCAGLREFHDQMNPVASTLKKTMPPTWQAGASSDVRVTNRNIPCIIHTKLV